ncbi:MAG: mevalonate kinase [Candidatus Liberibacter ctenarytainae]|uniref:Mevalonate kinase n=1 Tax=Candidatus Liberibacter ctenarytainae TaxID=2020335 RepID=A0A937AS35_9HYPH|nr:mevalonate kinase [Candidatus Liberibacter ctenarytainae]
MVQGLQRIRVDTPGSVVLMGEHGVLHGHTALACAINKVLTLYVTVRNDRLLQIHSSLGHYQGSLDSTMSHPLFSFILAAIDHFKPSCGLTIEITSHIDHQTGLGSSAAITASITAALLTLQNQAKPLKQEILKEAHDIVVKVQGQSSGMDLAASLYGGLILYCMSDYHVEPIPTLFPIHLVYSGYKKSTSQVLDIISHMETEYPSTKVMHQKLYALMGELSHIAAQAILDGQFKLLAQAMNMQQGLLETLGVSDQKLSEIVWMLRKQPDVMAAKISGSGLGDCVIALGKVHPDSLPYQSIHCTMHSEGLRLVTLTSSHSASISR